jgi:hypothetical protein
VYTKQSMLHISTKGLNGWLKRASGAHMCIGVWSVLGGVSWKVLSVLAKSRSI